MDPAPAALLVAQFNASRPFDEAQGMLSSRASRGG